MTQPNLLRHPPKLEYSGLTIVLSVPSRFDIEQQKLLSANGGHLLCTDILYPLGITRYNCDIRLSEDRTPLWPNTKCVLLLGSKSMSLWLPPEITKENKLDNLRGSPYQIDGLTYMCSYSPQDACDRQNYESYLNPEMLDWLELEVQKRQDQDPQGFKRRKGLTFRANYRFWLKKDVEKLVSILHKGMPNEEVAHYNIYPNSNDAINLLLSRHDSMLYFDIETDRLSGKITCFSFGFDLSNIVVVPVVLHDYTLAYSELALCQIFRALGLAIWRNTLVAWNGACFDYFMMAWKYKIAINRVFDPMVAQHRIYPLVEKSLGHGTSLWTHEVFHKDEIQFAFGNREQAQQLWAYCGKDVSTMIRITRAMLSYTQDKPGLQKSIEQAQQSIKPYLITTLLGIPYRADKVVEIMAENDRLMMALLKIIEWFIGPESWAVIKKRSKKPLPSSNPQCCMYFHEMLDYKVVMRSKKTKKPSLAEKPLLKLRLAYDNPVIDLIIAYRRAAKETSTLKLIPFNINNTQMLIE